MKGYHFTSDTLRNGEPIPAIGEWIRVEPPLSICQRGLHGSRHVFDALRYAPGAMLHKVETKGQLITQDDKFCAEYRMITASIDSTDILHKFARMCALDVIDLWDAPEVVVRYLKTGDEGLRLAARDAARNAARNVAWRVARNAARDVAWRVAWDAARDVAWDVAWAVAWDVAWDAARDAQKRRLGRLVNRAFKIKEKV